MEAFKCRRYAEAMPEETFDNTLMSDMLSTQFPPSAVYVVQHKL